MNDLKTTVFITCLLMLISFSAVFGQGHKEDQIIIKFTQGTSQQEQDDFIDNILGSIIDEDAEDNILVETPPPPYYTQDGVLIPSMVGLISAILSTAEIDAAGLNYLVTPTPLGYNEIQAYLNMPAYSPIDLACEATYPGGALLGCPVSENTGKVRIGIIDSGFDDSHQQPIPYIKGEIDVTDPDYDGTNPSSNILGGINGSDTYGYQGDIAVDGNNHGTQITGIITGTLERAGLGPQHAEIYIIKAFNDEGIGYVFDMKKAVDAASSLNVNLLNLSWSYVPNQNSDESELLRQSLLALSTFQNVIIVAGAGNDSQSLDVFDLAPAGFEDITNLITVASVDCNGDLSAFSNKGFKVDICAPGEEIICPILDGYWALNDKGTSFSTAIVTACLAEMWTAYFSNNGINTIIQPEHVAEIHDILLETANTSTSLRGKGIKGGVVNFSAACAAAFDAGIAGNSGSTGSTGSTGRLTEQTNNNNSFQTTSNTIKSSNEVKIYPSPVEENLVVSIQNTNSSKVARIEIFSLNGKKLIEKNIDQFSIFTKVDINMSGLPSGMYLLKVLQNGQTWSDLIVKK